MSENYPGDVNNGALQVARYKEAVQIDLLARDKNDEIILLAKIKASSSADQMAMRQIEHYLTKIPFVVPFAIIADNQKITIYRWDGNMLSEPIATLDTANYIVVLRSGIQQEKDLRALFNNTDRSMAARYGLSLEVRKSACS